MDDWQWVWMTFAGVTWIVLVGAAVILGVRLANRTQQGGP